MLKVLRVLRHWLLFPNKENHESSIELIMTTVLSLPRETHGPMNYLAQRAFLAAVFSVLIRQDLDMSAQHCAE